MHIYIFLCARLGKCGVLHCIALHGTAECVRLAVHRHFHVWSGGHATYTSIDGNRYANINKVLKTCWMKRQNEAICMDCTCVRWELHSGPFTRTIWWTIYHMRIASHLWCIECTNARSIPCAHSPYRSRCRERERERVLSDVRRLLRIVFSTNTLSQNIITNLNVFKIANWTRLFSLSLTLYSSLLSSRRISIRHMTYELIWNKLFFIRNLCCLLRSFSIHFVFVFADESITQTL